MPWMTASPHMMAADRCAAGRGWFETRPSLVPAVSIEDWDITLSDGPVVATAIHDGHAIRPSLRPLMALTPEQRLREEDPLTGLLTTVGDVRIRVPVSRFEVDLNRPRELAVYTRPEHCWGLEAWRSPLPQAEIERSLARWDRFYGMVAELLDHLLERWEAVLLIDLHSYNHRRDGASAACAPQQANPDIELGLTTAEPARWGGVTERFAQALRGVPIAGRAPDVRANVRFPTGGHFPEWVYARWGSRVCTISPEYKKIFMDEWTGCANIPALQSMLAGLQAAVDAVRPEFRRRGA
jgi:N-formylglutamate deformylase